MWYLEDRKQLGKILRARRLELGLKQKDLVDDILTPATISNIELGKKKAGVQKISYYCEKLHWKLEKIPQYLEETKKRELDHISKLKLKLKSIENDIVCVSPDLAIKNIKELDLPIDPYILSTVEYLKGKCFYKKGRWDKSKEHYNECIRIINEHRELSKSNLKSASFYELSRVYYRKNDLEFALKLIQNGLSAFVTEGERDYYKHYLLISEAIYLDKLGFTNAAMKALERTWTYLSEMDTETQLTMYSLQAILHNELKNHDEAISCINKAIDMAQRLKHFDHCFELWTTLGVSYKNLGDFDSAKTCFNTAYRFKNKLRDKYLLPAYNYTELGKLYKQINNMELAEKHLISAVKLSKKVNNEPKQLEAQVALGECYLHQNKITEAIQQFEEASKIAKRHLTKKEREIMLKLAQCYEKRDTVKYNKYLSRFYELSIKSQNGGELAMQQISWQNPQVDREFQPEPPGD
ncbi:hypothetical protein ADL26_04405 [Thermoactinomyces vulgaris]|jgi:tetratricopeptide (TPR) repeat protein|nr:hypothetical protein ADL26_04405 [Thermoactinomyces vulgaris]